MPKRLYRVDAFWYVMADSLEEAEEYRSLLLSSASVSASEATYLDSEWANAIPFNSDDDRTCGQLIHDKQP